MEKGREKKNRAFPKSLSTTFEATPCSLRGLLASSERGDPKEDPPVPAQSCSTSYRIRSTSSRSLDAISWTAASISACMVRAFGHISAASSISTARRRGKAVKSAYTKSAALIGRLRTRLPVAAKTALVTAGTIDGVVASPIPPGFSWLSTMWTSTTGISSMRRGS
jgi:hypothetical protein